MLPNQKHVEIFKSRKKCSKTQKIQHKKKHPKHEQNKNENITTTQIFEK